MSAWDYEDLWAKCKLYVARAFEADREGPLFPFWAMLALELLGRATLAKVHPALLADPQTGENILHVFGYGNIAHPKSVPAKTVFTRCKAVVADFTEDDFKTCMGMIERRNEELHAGAPAFEDLPTQLWLADYFRICNLLLASQGRLLTDLFDADEAAAGEEMIKAAEAEVIKRAKSAIAAAKAKFNLLGESEQHQQKTTGSEMAAFTIGQRGRLVTCPACGAQALLTGKQIRATEPELINDEIVRELIMLPTALRCYSCELALRGYGELHVAGQGGQYAIREAFDPVQYYSADLDPADYYEPDYGND